VVTAEALSTNSPAVTSAAAAFLQQVAQIESSLDLKLMDSNPSLHDVICSK
jgi:hypothetical protein